MPLSESGSGLYKHVVGSLQLLSKSERKKFWKLLREYPDYQRELDEVWLQESKSSVQWIRAYLRASKKAKRFTKNAKNEDRDAEICRLKAEKPTRSSQQIADLICSAHPEWALTEKGNRLDGTAVRSVLLRLKTG